VTDDQGRYNIVDLVAGTYTVTFSLTSFSGRSKTGALQQPTQVLEGRPIQFSGELTF
jgi:hypothetical protein